VRILLECASIDDLLGGGFEAGCITLLFGEAGSGKTNVCLQLARNVVRSGRRVVFIDTEGVSAERLEQICGDDLEIVAKNILFSEPYSLDEQERLIDKAIKIAEGSSEVGLVIVDSLTMHYRLTLRDEVREDRYALSRQIAKLMRASRKVGIPVVVTSQVYTDIETGEYLPLGGHTLLHSAKAILRLDKIGASARGATLIKHRALEEGRRAKFRITAGGVEP